MPRISLSTGSLGFYPLSITFAIAKKLGFDGLELFPSLEATIRGPDYVRRLSRRYDLPILSIHAPLLPLPGLGVLPFSKQTISLARELESSVVVFHALHPSANDKTSQVHFKALQAVEKLCHNGLHVTVENIIPQPSEQVSLGTFNQRRYVYSLDSVLAKKNFAVTLDTCHAALGGDDVLDAYQRLKTHVKNIHFSDLRSLSGHTRSLMLNSLIFHHQVPGTGVLPLRDFLKMLAEDDYDGLLTLELSPIALQIWSRRRAEENLSRALAFCRDNLTRCP